MSACPQQAGDTPETLLGTSAGASRPSRERISQLPDSTATPRSLNRQASCPIFDATPSSTREQTSVTPPRRRSTRSSWTVKAEAPHFRNGWSHSPRFSTASNWSATNDEPAEQEDPSELVSRTFHCDGGSDNNPRSRVVRFLDSAQMSEKGRSGVDKVKDMWKRFGISKDAIDASVDTAGASDAVRTRHRSVALSPHAFSGSSPEGEEVGFGVDNPFAFNPAAFAPPASPSNAKAVGRVASKSVVDGHRDNSDFGDAVEAKAWHLQQSRKSRIYSTADGDFRSSLGSALEDAANEEVGRVALESEIDGHRHNSDLDE